MKNITDDDLTLLYYGEHNDPGLAARVAASVELSTRFDALCTELQAVDVLVPPERGDDFGAEVWRRISPRLATGQDQPVSRWKALLPSLRQPRFSFAGAFSIAMVVTLAFFLGRQGGQPGEALQLESSAGPALVLADIDAGRLLTRSVSSHLEEVNLVFTQFANTPQSSETRSSEAQASETQSSDNEARRATDMLVANRLYRQAAVAKGDLKLAAFLAQLEPVLIELAYEAHKTSATTRDRMQQEIRNSLLFRVRVMNKQLNHSQIPHSQIPNSQIST